MKQFDPAMLGLIAGGAAMMDPRGTYGSSGAAINKGIQAGLRSYLPLAQFQARKKEAATRRKDVKAQNQFRNTLLERQMELSESSAEATAESRERTYNLQKAQFGLEQDKYQAELDRLKSQNKMLSQWIDPPVPTGVSGPRVDNDPRTSLPPGYGGQQQWGPRDEAIGAMAIQSGVEPGAVRMLAESRRPIIDPTVKGYSRSAHYTWLEGEKAVRQLTPKEEAQRAALEKSAGDPMKKVLAEMFQREMKNNP